MTEEVKKETGAGRPLHPKWDKMHDLDRYITYCDMILRNLITGKWKSLPRGVTETRLALREAMMNKYPDYFKAVDPEPAQVPLVAEMEEELPPLKTLESPKEEPAFIAQPFPKD